MSVPSHGDMYESLRNRELALRGAGALALGLTALLFGIDVTSFLLLYALYVGFAMVLTTPLMFIADRSSELETPVWQDFIVVALLMAALWGLAVLWPLWAVWSGVRELDEPPMTAVAYLAAAGTIGVMMYGALQTGLRYRQLPAEARREMNFKQPAVERALCIIAFVIFGPYVFMAVQLAGEVWSPLGRPAVALVITYAVCEAYPFAATLADRVLAVRKA